MPGSAPPRRGPVLDTSLAQEHRGSAAPGDTLQTGRQVPRRQVQRQVLCGEAEWQIFRQGQRQILKTCVLLSLCPFDDPRRVCTPENHDLSTVYTQLYVKVELY